MARANVRMRYSTKRMNPKKRTAFLSFFRNLGVVDIPQERICIEADFPDSCLWKERSGSRRFAQMRRTCMFFGYSISG